MAAKRTPIPPGTVFTVSGSKWRLGRFIAKGGFGDLYLTQEDTSPSAGCSNDAQFVAKFEPIESGPLFCEVNFYMRTKACSLAGVPQPVGVSKHTHNGRDYRVLVIPRLGTDLQKILDANNKQLPPPTVFLLGYRLLEILKGIHAQGYTHGDIKAANIMTGFKDPEELFLIDYGLVFLYHRGGVPKSYKADPKNIHNGTIEVTCRDAHKGAAVSPRGDLETLGFCMWQWLCGRLPWEDVLKNKESVAARKDLYMQNIDTHIRPLLANSSHADKFCKFLKEVAALRYTDTPPYDRFRRIFKHALESLGGAVTDRCKLLELR